jgi:dolichyl-diphosphooligosaccharide--protein glycosyltransferase
VYPVPVLPNVYAETFLELRERTEADALLWQWWDYGYAGQYYAERATFGDGSRQAGPWLYPLAKVHCSVSSRESAQLMRYFGQAMLDSGLKSSSDVKTALFRGVPVAEIREMDAGSAQQFIRGLANTEENYNSSVSNYFVVSWENLRLAGWISYYGNWDIVTGTSSPGKMQRIQGEVRIDSAAGSLMINGQPMSIDSLNVVEEKGTKRFEWPNGSGSHVLINQGARQVFLMDDKMYRSMMVQMLIAPPELFAEDFTLVVDRFPWVRAYKVKN